MKKYFYSIATCITMAGAAMAQDPAEVDSIIKTISINEVVISVNKTEETKKTIAQQIQVLTAKEIENTQSQTTADLMTSTGNISVQKSQQGGGSPVLRGFEASRVLLVIDGVRMNNIIYRAGHLQNIITMDNSILDRVEILFGPSSTIYGSDALGGVVHFYSKKPLFATDEKKNLKVNAFSRFGSANNEKTGHVDFNIGGKNLASLTSFTFSNFDDLKGGMNQNPYYTSSYGERPYYAERINGKDSLVLNPNRYVQTQSGYSQYDLLQKFAYKPGVYTTHGLNIQYSNSTNVPRYDRLSEGNGGKYAEWYYGPQMRMLAAYDLNRKKLDATFQNVHFGVNYQNIEESRHSRRFGNDLKSNQIEKVSVIGANLDLQKIMKTHNMRFGADMQYNTLKSTANEEDIVTGTSEKLGTRYPDGDNTMMNLAAYWSHTWQVNDLLTVTDGIRGGFASLHSTLADTALYHLPYTVVDQKSPVFSGNIGFIHSPTDDLKLSFMLSSGYRVPNVDDLAKIFDPPSGGVVVPNVDLKPERSINYEFGMTNILNQKTRWENFIYYTDLIDVALVDTFQLNGQDSIVYDGVMSRVYANQNKKRAYIYGFSSNLRTQCSDHLMMAIMLNYTYGRVKTDSSDAPLDHIPPIVARFQLNYTQGKFMSDFFINYNAWKRIKDFGGGEDNPQYAPVEGMPAWYTLNLHLSYKLHKLVTVQTGVDNILDTQYRTFSSGINSAGRNVFAAVRFHY